MADWEGSLEGAQRPRRARTRRTVEGERGRLQAFRDFYRARPRYSMLPVHRTSDAAAGPAASSGEVELPAEDRASAAEVAAPSVTSTDEEPVVAILPAGLLPAGPLVCVWLSPDPLRVECRGTRRVRATALDATNRAVDGPVVYRWSLVGPVGTLLEMENATGRAVFTAAEQPAQGRIAVVAYSGDREASAEADVIVLDELGDRRSVHRPHFAHLVSSRADPRHIGDVRDPVESSRSGGVQESHHGSVIRAETSARSSLIIITPIEHDHHAGDGE